MDGELPKSGLPVGKRVPASWPAGIVPAYSESDEAGECKRRLGDKLRLSFEEFYRELANRSR